MQLDAEENEDVFYKPPVEPAARSDTERSTSGETSTEAETSGLLAADNED